MLLFRPLQSCSRLCSIENLLFDLLQSADLTKNIAVSISASFHFQGGTKQKV